MICPACGGTDITINTFEESKAGCWGVFNWILIIIIAIVSVSTGFIIVLIIVGVITFIYTAVTGGIPGLLGIKKKTKTVCICKTCSHKWEI